jgi:hypothetical protein
MKTTVTIRGLPELLRELQRLSPETAQGRVARNMTMPGERMVLRHDRLDYAAVF